MNRSTRTFVVVIIAVGVAALASFGVFRAIQQMPVREVEVRSLHQVVAVRELAMGDRITKDDVKLVPWPASSPVEKGFTTIEAVLNRGLIDGVVANEPLTEASWRRSRRAPDCRRRSPRGCGRCRSRSTK